jgi:hypothetical protein
MSYKVFVQVRPNRFVSDGRSYPDEVSAIEAGREICDGKPFRITDSNDWDRECSGPKSDRYPVRVK